jgi:ABC-type uncharacterized transport system auxiliary subunit
MKTHLVLIAALPLLAGCLGTAPKAPRNWTVDWSGPSADAAAEAAAGAPSAKLLQLEVLAPYGGTRLAVLRGDGSVAFDHFNSFAAQPASLLKGAAFDVVEQSGVFSRVVRPSSSAAADFALEVTVTRLALDCRAEGRTEASVALSATLVGGRAVVSSARAEASAPVSGGNFSAAFSRAFEESLLAAVRSLKAR